MDQHTHATVQRLLTAIRKSGEFPAMAKTVGLFSVDGEKAGRPAARR